MSLIRTRPWARVGLACLASPALAQDFQPVAPMYHTGASMEAILHRWHGMDPEGLQLHSFGEEPGASLLGLEISHSQALPPAERRVVWVLGGLDGLSLVGSEGALWSASYWLRERESLPRDVSLVILPWGSPRELNAVLRNGPQALLPDGQDMDGDGQILEMLTEDPAGQWVRSVDPRFLALAGPEDSGRLRHSVEGGLSPVGLLTGMQSVFPGGARWGGADWSQAGRALADQMLSRRTAAVVVLGGAGARIGLPASCLPEDRATYEGLARGFDQSCAQAEPLCALESSESAFLDWCYKVLEVPAFELRMWQPLSAPCDQPEPPGWRALRPTCRVDQRWGAWLDEELAGFGFVEWRPVDSGDGRRAWVGGWRQRTRWNPPESLLEATLAPVPGFLGELVGELPRLELAVVEATRDQDLCRLVVEVRSHGRWPLASACSGRWTGGSGEGEAWLELELPEGALRLAGPARRELPELRGGGPVRLEWLLSAPDGSSFLLSTGAPGAGRQERRLQP